MKTFAVIPTKYASIETLAELLAKISKEETVERIYLMDNKHLVTYEYWPWHDPKVDILGSYGLTIYQMWNFAWRKLREEYPKDELNIAFLNYDIKIYPDYNSGEYLSIMADFLRCDRDLGAVYPDYDHTDTGHLYTIKYTDSTAGAGGMSGYCFMLKGELEIPYVDEAFQLYWGDDDLVKQITLAGYKIGRIQGLPIDHTGSATIKTLDPTERYNLMEQDRKHFNEKYGENRGPVW